MFSITEKSNYLAKVVTLGSLRKHPNADRLQIATVDHQDVIVGLDAKEGDACIYVPLEAQISSKFLAATNSFSDSNLNVDKSVKGFFNSKGRVRAIRLRGFLSEGYIIPNDSFNKYIESEGKYKPDVDLNDYIGVEFDSIDGTMFCKKYVVETQRKGPANTPKIPKKKVFNRIIPGQFHFHVETSQLKKNLEKISPNDTITVSYKLHGTSLVAGNLLVRRKLTLVEKIAKFFGAKISDTVYDLVYSSRKVIKNQYEVPKEHQHYYKEDIWAAASERLKPYIEEGITLYAEIVGQTANGSWIQKNYDYGTKPCDFDIYIYRITYTSPNGAVREFTTNQMIRYCRNYSLKTVPIDYVGLAEGYVQYLPEDAPTWHEALLKALTQAYLERRCRMCNNNVPAEGVVVTVEKDYFEAYKLKSQAFYEMETKNLDNEEVGVEE